MKYVFEIATEASVVGAIATVSVIAISSIVILSPPESRPASLAAVGAIVAVVHTSLNAVRRKPSSIVKPSSVVQSARVPVLRKPTTD